MAVYQYLLVQASNGVLGTSVNCTFDDIHMCGYTPHVYGHAVDWFIINGSDIRFRTNQLLNALSNDRELW